MKPSLAGVILPILLLTSCVTPPVTLSDLEPAVSEARQAEAQKELNDAVAKLTLKRKVAVGRLSNETTYGKSLLSDNSTDKMADKVSDMFVQGLTNSGNYLIFERPDIEILQAESARTNAAQSLIGVDTLIVGSLTEFGRVTTGQAGFLSSTKRQEATATIDIRLVDVATGQVIQSLTGTGVSSTETQSTLGFGSVAGYDGSINDQAIGAAVNAVVAKLDAYMLEKTWSADILAFEDGLVYISGGASQGLAADQVLDVFTKGRQVTSTTTGGTITLPGQKIASIQVVSTFGDAELEEGSVAIITSGTIEGIDLSSIEVREVR